MATSPSDDVIVSMRAAHPFEPAADPRQPHWRDVPCVTMSRTFNGDSLPAPHTQVRSRWTPEHLYLLYSCPYDTLHLKPDPDLATKTPHLWDWDVAEAFIGSDAQRLTVYKEFQVSPQGEWVDLAIDREKPDLQTALNWRSGFTVSARIEPTDRTWYGEMKIPFEAIESQGVAQGLELRIGLFRISGHNPRVLHLWRPTGRPNFHVPEAFGRIRLE
jgi:hypothetical protein